MASLAIITPSYGPDAELCRDLNASVLSNTETSTVHYLVVPRRDLSLFAALRGPRTQVWCVDDLLPRYIFAVPRVNFWINGHQPFPPIRGWIVQQAVKLRAASLIEADVLLSVDSDVVFVRPVTTDTFRRDGRICLYRKDASIDSGLPRHLIWHDVARTLLGASPENPPLPDYIHSPNVWDHHIIVAMLKRIEEQTGRPWIDAICRQLYFSECTLYGVFVDNVLGEDANVAPVGSMRCHNYWETSPLSAATAEAFVHAIPADDVAVMISAKSGTPLDIRRAALSRLR